MSRFPDRKPDSMHAYLDGYAEELTRAVATVSRDAMTRAAAMLKAAIDRDANIFSLGNGGSAAIANHLVCDYGKGIRGDTHYHPRVRSLSSNPEIITAIGNDISFDEVFVHQLEGFARKGDLVISVSSSGNSENIVRAVQWAKDNGVESIAMTGFGGGRSAEIADVNLHVDCDNYGVVEDLHQSLMHVLAQFTRTSAMDANLISDRKF